MNQAEINILSRRSIRKYSDKEISDDIIEKILKAGMAAPSAHNYQGRMFWVVNDKNKIKELYERHEYARSLATAPMVIVVFADTNKNNDINFGIQDCSAALENMALMAKANGISSVWMGIYNNENPMKAIKDTFDYEDNFVPISMMAFGYAIEEKEMHNEFLKEQVRYN